MSVDSMPNRESEFVLVNVAGESKVRITDGTEEIIVKLDKPMMGVYALKCSGRICMTFPGIRYFWY